MGRGSQRSVKSWQERRDDGVGLASVQLELEAASHTSKRARRVGLAGEFPGGLKVYQESASSPLSSPPPLSPDTDNQGERERGGSLGSHSSQNHQGGLPSLRAAWQGPLVGLDTTAA